LAYEVEGDVYYRVSAFEPYGCLSKRNLEEMEASAGSRVEVDERKESPLDFAVWKAAKPDEPSWPSPWGQGRPGWHIECSAMSTKILGDHFDIHTGGVDNMFPHHENEIAQSQGATGEQFVNFWMHCEYLIVDGRKMSKSLGNFYTPRDIVEKGYPPVAMRYLLISTHYRQQLNFTFQGLDAARSALERYNDFISNLEDFPGGEDSGGEAAAAVTKAETGFEEALDSDLNISEALGVVFDFIREINRLKADKKLSVAERDTALNTIGKFDTVLNFTFGAAASSDIDAEVEALIVKRTEARKSKDFALADQIRDELLAKGIVLEDTAQGVKWKRKI
jgi:cysteinyl-tRNA synthetase